MGTESWPPKLPDVSMDSVQLESNPFAFSPNAELYKVKGCSLVYKMKGYHREYNMMKAAGDCAVKAHGRVFMQIPIGQVKVGMMGFLMALETPLDPKMLLPSQDSIPTPDPISPSQRNAVMEKMIYVVQLLHDRGIIHGDIKMANMLICSDGMVRLCDFAEARFIGEDPSDYEGKETANYLSPRRCQDWREADFELPEVEDDDYALGLAIWELYTGRIPFDGWYGDDIWDYVAEGKTVDVNEVEDVSVRPIILQFLRRGGDKVANSRWIKFAW
ncbi:MAG: hypothetical protein M1820_003263 [Bogoriella megaspora]|nr:MAG: hypothetical protein M1820_003263 [Bogoriella megaspora]